MPQRGAALLALLNPAGSPAEGEAMLLRFALMF